MFNTFLLLPCLMELSQRPSFDEPSYRILPSRIMDFLAHFRWQIRLKLAVRYEYRTNNSSVHDHGNWKPWKLSLWRSAQVVEEFPVTL